MAQPKQQPVAATATAPASFHLSDKTKTRILWALFAVWAVLVTVGIAYHEQWRDEGSDWTTVRHVSIGQLFGTMIPEIGHPPMWYFLMYPLGNMGLPLVTVNIVSALVMALAMYLMLFKIPFPFYLKLALVFPMFFVYEYPVVGRNYCLVVLFLMLVLWYYPKRFEKPLVYGLIVAGLFNTHNLGFFITFGLTILFIWEMVEFKKVNGRTIGAALIMLVGGLYLIPYMALPQMKAANIITHITDPYMEMKKALGNGLLIGGIEDPNTTMTLGLLVFVVLSALLLPRLKPFAVFVCGAGGLLYVLSTKYVGQHRHHGLIMVEFLFAYGLAGYYAIDKFTLKSFARYNPYRIGTIILAAILFWQSRFGLSAPFDEMNSVFSDGKPAAEFLMENHLEHKVLLGHQSWAASSVLQQLPANCKMYWADTRRWGYYIRFDSAYLANNFKYPMGDYGAVVAERDLAKDIKDVVLVLNSPIQSPQIAQLWTERYRGGIWAGEDQAPNKKQESFIIYTRNPQVPTAVNMPPVDSIFKAQ